MKRLRFDNDTLAKVTKLVKYHDLNIEPVPTKVRKAIVKVTPELFPYLLNVKKADILAQSNYKREEKEKKLEELRAVYQQILEEGDCLTLKDMAVTGKDLIEYGMKPGKELGEALQNLFQHVLEYPQDNQKEKLLELIRHK